MIPALCRASSAQDCTGPLHRVAPCAVCEEAALRGRQAYRQLPWVSLRKLHCSGGEPAISCPLSDCTSEGQAHHQLPLKQLHIISYPSSDCTSEDFIADDQLPLKMLQSIGGGGGVGGGKPISATPQANLHSLCAAGAPAPPLRWSRSTCTPRSRPCGLTAAARAPGPPTQMQPRLPRSCWQMCALQRGPPLSTRCAAGPGVQRQACWHALLYQPPNRPAAMHLPLFCTEAKL